MRRQRRATLALTAAQLACLAAPGAAQAADGDPAADLDADLAPTVAGLDLERATILDLQRAMNAGRLTSERLTQLYLDRIQRLNPSLHAVITVNPDALALARASDATRRRTGPRGPLEGIPVLLKDNIDTADRQPTTAGSYALERARPSADAFLVRRLRAAGAVILGKANLSEWANFRSIRSTSGWSAVGGQTNNPYALDRNPGGSSSGSAVAAAAHLATVTIGTETHGSIACPAGANAAVGVKPTLGLVSRSGIVPISAQQDTAGPITRNVTDAALVLAAIQGPDPADPATRDAAGRGIGDLRAVLDPDALRGKRIGVWRQGGYGIDPEVDRVFDAAVQRLRALGATVVEGADVPYLDVVGENEFPALVHEFKHDVNAYLAATPGEHPADLAELIAFNRAHADVELKHFGQELFEQAEATSGDLSDPAYARLRRLATAYARRGIDETLARHQLDAIVAPANGPAWKTDYARGDAYVIDSSTPAAVSGYASVTVPAGYAQGELPLGLSFIGDRWSDARLLALAYAFEQATGARRPPAPAA
ncbi:amidase [Carbonactinospora thermoautotrophica]|uniref:Amidase n=3 Tax=Carbonactinospora thermoautotrophica TaxID=1469144 RepID=A0A132N4R2_9ACTN|nr:amidase [Carbonactinospora thermoautotrophica]